MKFVAIILLMAVTSCVAGCGIVIDSVREAAGRPGTELTRTRTDAVTQTFALSYEETYAKVMDVLDTMQATIYMQNKKERFIIAMDIDGSIDTTEVGIFFVREEAQKTTVEVASKSRKAKQTVASKITEALNAP